MMLQRIAGLRQNNWLFPWTEEIWALTWASHDWNATQAFSNNLGSLRLEMISTVHINKKKKRKTTESHCHLMIPAEWKQNLIGRVRDVVNTVGHVLTVIGSSNYGLFKTAGNPQYNMHN